MMTNDKTNSELIDQITDAAGELARRAGRKIKKSAVDATRATGRAIKRGAVATADYVDEHVTAENAKKLIQSGIDRTEARIQELDDINITGDDWVADAKRGFVAATRGSNLITYELLRFMLVVGLDNKILNWLQSAYKNNKNSVRNAYMTWYLMLLLMVSGASISVEKGVDVAREKIEDVRPPRKDKAVNQEWANYQEYYNARKDFVISAIPSLIMAEGNAKGYNQKTKMFEPYWDPDGKCWTIGWGNTRTPDFKPVGKNTPPITHQQALEWAEHHLTTETLWYMYCYEAAGYLSVDSPEMCMMFLDIFYNMGQRGFERDGDRNCIARMGKYGSLRTPVEKGNWDALTVDLVRDEFKKHPPKIRSLGKQAQRRANMRTICNTLGGWCEEGGGIYARRWFQAGEGMGFFTAQNIMDMPINGIYDFSGTRGANKNQDFIIFHGNNARAINQDTYSEFQRWCGASRKEKISSYITPEYMDKINNACTVSKLKFIVDMTPTVDEDKEIVMSFKSGTNKVKRQAENKFMAGLTKYNKSNT